MSVIIPKDGLPNREALQEFLKQHEYSSTSAYKAEQARGRSWCISSTTRKPMATEPTTTARKMIRSTRTISALEIKEA